MTSFAFSTPVQAQADGFVGWVSPAGPGGAWPTADEACRAQWERFQGDSPASRYIGAFPWQDNFRFADCQWTTWSYLCNAETGGGILDCGTIWPSHVRLDCASGYTATADGLCREDPAPERPVCECDEEGRINPTVGNPIVLSTGAKVLSATDYESADGEFQISRYYRTFQVGAPLEGSVLPRPTRGMGGRWNFNFGLEIQLGTFSGSPSSPNAVVGVILPDGTGYRFNLQTNGTWAPDTSLGAYNAATGLKLEFVGTLPTALSSVKSASSTWKLTDTEDNVWTFETRAPPNSTVYQTAWATQRVASSGYTWNFAYAADSSLESITDSFGRVATFEWYAFQITPLSSPPAGSHPFPLNIKSISLPDGTSLRYTYNAPLDLGGLGSALTKRLVKAERLSAASAVLDSTSYLYEAQFFPFHITGILDARDERIGTYAYDSQGRATLTQGANGADRFEVEFSTSGTSRIRHVTNALGKEQTYTFARFNSHTKDYRLTTIAGVASANTVATTSSIAYNSGLFIATTANAEGTSTVLTRDARGRPTSIVEADNEAEERTTTITWHSTWNAPATIVKPGLIEDYTYNSTGQLIGVTQTDTTSHSLPYSTNGQTRSHVYDWNADGRLLSVNGPLPDDGIGNDDLTTYAYDSLGNLLTVTSAAGHVTTYDDYDANGRPGTVTDPNGVVTAYAYDALGRVETVTAEHPSNALLNAVTSIDYDAIGQVIGVTLPSTDKLIMDYDAAGRLTSMRAASGERWDYAYDAMGNVLRETVKRTNGTTLQRISRGFDELGRLIRETVGLGQAAQFSYDELGQLVSSVSPNGHQTTVAFDPLRRLVSTVAPDGGTTALEYGPLDNLVEHTDPISVATEFVYNGFGEVIQEVSSDRGASTYVYDEAGQVVQSTDGRGQVIDYTRDYLSRITASEPQGRPSSEIVTYYWDAGGLSGSYEVGRLAKVVDGSGTTEFRYDHRGNVLAKQQVIGSTSTAQLAYEYDVADRITQITYPSGRLVKYSYDSKGRVSAVETKANASVGSWTLVANTYSYEPFGPVAAMTLGNGLAVENARGLDGRLASRRLYRTLDDSSLSHLTYRHDENGNIGSITDQLNSANSTLYAYDEVDRLIMAVADAGAPSSQTYTYTSGTNQLASLTDTSGTRTIAYDDRGNTASETRPGSVTVAADYDGYGRLIAYDRSNAGAQDYAYNGLNDRVEMVTPSATRRFVYDADGRVMGEYGVSATDVHVEYIWALPQAGSASPFGGDDGVGGYAPLAVATPDAMSAIQLNWIHGDHLGVPLVATDPAGNVASTPDDYLAPGFPGQSRVFADLYYNRHRDYDPTTGRYIQSDPIGLGGGSNGYLYVNGNPVNLVDPLGLQAVLPMPRGFPIPIPRPSGPDSNGNGINDWTEEAGRQLERNLNDLGDLICRNSVVCRYLNPPREDCPPDKGGDDDCEKEWDEAYKMCAAELAKPYPNRRITGGYRDLQRCARGLVSQRCGGNQVAQVDLPNLGRTFVARREQRKGNIRNGHTTSFFKV